MNTQIEKTPLDKAIEYFDGNQAALARSIDPEMTTMTITHWKKRGVPACRYYDIQEATNKAVTTDDFFNHAKKSKAA